MKTVDYKIRRGEVMIPSGMGKCVSSTNWIERMPSGKPIPGGGLILRTVNIADRRGPAK